MAELNHHHPHPERYLRLAQIVGPNGLLPISKSKFYELVASGEIPPPQKPFGRISLWKASSIIAFVESKGRQ